MKILYFLKSKIPQLHLFYTQQKMYHLTLKLKCLEIFKSGTATVEIHTNSLRKLKTEDIMPEANL